MKYQSIERETSHDADSNMEQNGSNLKAFIKALIITPLLIITFGHSTWQLIDYHIHYLPFYTLFIISSVIIVAVKLMRYFYNPKCVGFYDYVHNVASITFWWSLWEGGETVRLENVFLISLSNLLLTAVK